MNYLLDTCTFLWLTADDPKLSLEARRILIDPNNEVVLSTVSMWELTVKHGLGAITLPEPPEQFLRTRPDRYNLRTLPLNPEAIYQLPRLPKHHRDPFDRMLICQAIAHGMTLLTPDTAIHRYAVSVTW